MSTPLFLQGLEKLPYQDEHLPIYYVKTANGDIGFVMFGETTEFRVRTFFTKEPETLAWIDEFKSGDVFWDIGANIGCYSMYAASRRDINVCAFEPSPANFWLLSVNSSTNDFGNALVTYPFALSDRTGIIQWSPSIVPGGADNQLLQGGQSAVQAYSIDDLIDMSTVQFPNHIKLDVDGIERLILTGAEKMLGDKRLCTIMVEIDERNDVDIDFTLKLLKQSGFQAPKRRHAPYFDNNYYLPISNYLFKK